MKRLIIIIISLSVFSCTTGRKATDEKVVIHTTPEKINTPLTIEFSQGKAFNHPSFALWIEDLEGNYIETLYVTKYVATGTFGHGEIEPGKWKNEPGEVRRPATLPYWAHKRNIKAPDGLYVPSAKTAVPDALTAATPTKNFILKTGTKINPNQKFRVLFEINQPWDSNNFWTNNKFPGDRDYFTSLQPALVYAVTINPESEDKEYYLNPIGHSDPSGRNGKLYTDLTSLTTAKEIAQKIIVFLK
jgi:hypothetical protein